MLKDPDLLQQFQNYSYGYSQYDIETDTLQLWMRGENQMRDML